MVLRIHRCHERIGTKTEKEGEHEMTTVIIQLLILVECDSQADDWCKLEADRHDSIDHKDGFDIDAKHVEDGFLRLICTVAALLRAKLIIQHTERRYARQLHQQVSKDNAVLAAVVQMYLDLLHIIAPATATEKLFALVFLAFFVILWEYLRVIANYVRVATWDGCWLLLLRLLIIIFWLR